MPMKEDPSDVKIALSLVAAFLMIMSLILVKMVRGIVRGVVARVPIPTKKAPA